MIISRLRKIHRLIYGFRKILKIYIQNDRELPKTKLRLQINKRIYCLMRGFLVDKYNLYNFKENDSKLYVSDIYDSMIIPKNGFYQKLIDNKAFLPIILKEYIQYLPNYYFAIYKPRILDHINNRYIDCDVFLQEIYSLLEKKGKVILKPFSRSNSNGFVLLSKTDNRILYNNEHVSENELNKKISELNDYICTECVDNSNYIKYIYPYSLNTIRFLTIFDNKENKPFIAMAVHKFGLDPEIAVDKGVSSEIDLKTGILSKALWLVENCMVETSDVHPTTKVKVEGVKIENWETIVSKLMEIVGKMPFLPYMGFDIAPTEDGFRIIEINSNPELDLLQRHRPLLTDERTVNFYNQFMDRIPENYFYKR